MRGIYTIESLEARASTGTETSEAELRDTSPKVKWVMTATSQQLHIYGHAMYPDPGGEGACLGRHS